MFRNRHRGVTALVAREQAFARTKAAGARLDLVAKERGARSEKFLFGLEDGYAIESVLIRRRDGFTACVSSQVGCAFSCRFCASGQAGLKRNLAAEEIVAQVVHLGPRVNRVVFMGIGEPLHNYDEVLRAIRVLRDRAGSRSRPAGSPSRPSAYRGGSSASARSTWRSSLPSRSMPPRRRRARG